MKLLYEKLNPDIVYYGTTKDFLGNLGPYKKARDFLEKNGHLEEEKLLNFLYEGKLIPINNRLFVGDSSAYELLNEKYDMVFVKPIEIIYQQPLD